MSSQEAVLEEVGGRPALRFERLLGHPPERVWSALTDPGEQHAWHPTPATLDPRPGGAVAFDTKGKGIEFADGEVIQWDPPRLLAYTWGGGGEDADLLRWELRPHDDGCLLVLVHSFGDRLKAARDGAGWHVCLDALAADLDGKPKAAEPMPHESTWGELNAAYQRKFGIAPEEATPPPKLD
jgi:uncharacterized protein YndB with AHSA1/START domain